MVRFHWHVEGGLSAFVSGPQTTIELNGGASLFQIPMQVELAGQKEAFEAVITVRSTYLQEGQIRPLGVAIAHDSNTQTWNGKLLSALAKDLAQDGASSCRAPFQYNA